MAAGDPLGPEAVALAADLRGLAQQLDDLRRLDSADVAIGNFLDRWAVRQARRKAPQLHGAEAVLAFRQAVRDQRRQQQRALARAWQPVRGRRLLRRVALLLRTGGVAIPTHQHRPSEPKAP
jgi:hypothetical protein